MGGVVRHPVFGVAMAHTHPTIRTYVTIYGWLVVLTVLEIGVVMLNWPKTAIVLALLGTAVAKAILIALFLMHLKFDRPIIWLLPGIPLILAAVLLLALFPDIVLHATGV
jgi:cytochrome c oxidase subunit IV